MKMATGSTASAGDDRRVRNLWHDKGLDVSRTAQKAVDYAVKRFRPKSVAGGIDRPETDTSVTGWFVMGLQARR